MKVKLSFLFGFVLMVSSCSPASILFLQNNSDEPVEIYVELNTDRYRKVMVKESNQQYRGTNNPSNISKKSFIKYAKENYISEDKFMFTSDFNYNFTLKPNRLVNIQPNNSLSIYPFEKIYYVQQGKKCHIVPEMIEQGCTYTINSFPKLRELLQIEN
ncbi:MAG: hypothetical protein ACOH1X_08295 [Kaistella sp.]